MRRRVPAADWRPHLSAGSREFLRARTGPIREGDLLKGSLGSPPQLSRGEFGALAEGPQLHPAKGGVHCAESRERAESAIAAGDHTLSSHDIGKTNNPLRDKLRVLDVVADGGDHAGHQHLIGRQLDGRPDLLLVFVARVGGFNHKRGRLGLQGDGKNLGARHVMHMRTFIVPPANVKAHAVRGRVGERMVQSFHLEPALAFE